MLDLTPPKAVFFDWDGTLVDTIAFLLGAHNYARTQFGMLPFSMEEFTPYFGTPRAKLYNDIYGENKKQAQNFFERYVRENHLTGVKPLPGALPLLQFLHERAIPMGVVSNKKPEFLVKETRNFGWEHYFKSLVGAGECEADKPAPEPLFLALERAQIQHSPPEIWYVGDTKTDLQCARAAGCASVYISNTGHDENAAREYQPVITARDNFEFLEAVEALFKEKTS